jgi:hypothetical protein
MTSYAELDKQLQGRCAQSRKLGNNTYAHRDGAAICIRLHATDILTFYPNGSLQVATGGWLTITTKKRINEFLPAGMYIFSRDCAWWVKRPWQNRADEEFHEGWLITPEEVAVGMLRDLGVGV